MQSRERLKYLFGISGVKPYAIILEDYLEEVLSYLRFVVAGKRSRIDLDLGSGVFLAELDRVIDEIVKQLIDKRRITFDSWKRCAFD